MYTRCPPNTQGNFSECFMHRQFSEQVEVGVICAICACHDSFELGWTWCPKCHVFTFYHFHFWEIQECFISSQWFYQTALH
jgi:hypothetical protein